MFYILNAIFMQWHYQSNPNNSPPSCKHLALPVHTQKDQMTQCPPHSIFFGHPPTAGENHCHLKLQTIRHFITLLCDFLNLSKHPCSCPQHRWHYCWYKHFREQSWQSLHTSAGNRSSLQGWHEHRPDARAWWSHWSWCSPSQLLHLVLWFSAF